MHDYLFRLAHCYLSPAHNRTENEPEDHRSKVSVDHRLKVRYLFLYRLEGRLDVDSKNYLMKCIIKVCF